MFNFIRKLFKARVFSLDEFIKLVIRENGTDVLIRATEKHTIFVGVGGRPRIRLARFRHNIEYTAVLNGRIVSFRKAVLKSRGFERDAANALVKFATDVQRVADELRQQLPQVEVRLVGPDMSDLRPGFRPHS